VIRILLTIVLLLPSACVSGAPTAISPTPPIGNPQGHHEPAADLLQSYSNTLKSIPAPPGFTNQRMNTSAAGGEPIAMSNWSGPGSVDATIEYFKTTMFSLGWTEEYTFGRPDGGQVAYQKDDKVATITLMQRGTEVNIGILVAKAGYGKGDRVSGISGQVTAPPTAIPATPPFVVAPPTTGSSPPPPQILIYRPDIVAPELQSLPLPLGFELVEGSARHFSQGDGYTLALATWAGQGDLNEVGEYYNGKMGEQGWTTSSFRHTDDGFYAVFTHFDLPAGSVEVVTSKAEDERIIITIVAKNVR
jgi:hypothetical protein